MLHICLAIVSLIGLIMNGYILVVVLLTKQVSANNILLIHLGLIDVLLCFFFFSFSLPIIAGGGSDNWLDNLNWVCTLEGLLLALLNPLAMWTTCGLNCDRFYAIASPLHYSAIVNPRRVLIGLGIGWVVVIFLAIPPLVTRIAPFQFIPELAACFPKFIYPNSIYYTGLYSLITFVVPAIIILGCNVKVLQIAKRHRHRIASAIYEVTLSAQVTITHQRNPFFVPTITAPSAGGPRFRSRSPVSSTSYLVGSFLLLYCPFYVAILFQSISVYFVRNEGLEKCGKYLLIIASGLLVGAPSVNGALYGLKSKVLRKSFQNYRRKQMSKNEINHEIQARTPSTCGSRRPSLTPFGLLSRPCLRRQMSELFLDSENNHLPGAQSTIKRTSSELAWPTSSRFEIGNGRGPGEGASLPHTASCSTLVVPQNDNELASTTEQELYLTIKNSFRSASGKHQTNGSPNPRNFTLNISSHNSNQSNSGRYKYTNLLMSNRSFNGGAKFLNKVLRFDSGHQMMKVPSNADRRESIQPQILITSACSVDQISGDEDEDVPPPPLPEVDSHHYALTNSTERMELCSFSNKSTETDESTILDHSGRELQYLGTMAGSNQGQDTSEENSTTITTIAQSVSRPKQKRVQSLDDAYRGGSPTSSISENEEQLLLLSWPIASRKVQVVKGNKTKCEGVSRVVVDDEEVEIDFQKREEDPQIVCKSIQSMSQDLYSSSESIPVSTPSSVSLFSDRMEPPEIII